MFDLLKFEPHNIPNAVAARYKFENGWEISVVSGDDKCGLYGRIAEETYEVGLFRPNGNLTEDVSGWNTKQEVSAMMWVLSQL
jgi:surface protein